MTATYGSPPNGANYPDCPWYADEANQPQDVECSDPVYLAMEDTPGVIMGNIAGGSGVAGNEVVRKADKQLLVETQVLLKCDSGKWFKALSFEVNYQGGFKILNECGFVNQQGTLFANSGQTGNASALYGYVDNSWVDQPTAEFCLEIDVTCGLSLLEAVDSTAQAGQGPCP